MENAPMKRLLILAAAASAAVLTSGCIMVNGADISDELAWHGNNAQPFDASRDDCHRTTDSDSAFRVCMADKGWTRS